MKKPLIIFLLNFLFAGALLAQNVADFADYKTKYKDKDIVYLQVKTGITIDIAKANLVVKENKFEEIYYNNYKAGAFSEDDIKYSQFSKLNKITASTLLPDNDKFKEVKVKDFKTQEILSDDAFYEDLFSTSFTFPSLREGAITKVNSTYTLSEPKFLAHQFVTRYYPVENYEFTIDADKNVDLEIKYFHTDSTNLVFTKTEKNGRILYTWKAANLKGYKTEDNAPSIYYYLPQIIPYIKTYKVKGVEKPVLRNIDDLVKWYRTTIKDIDTSRTDEMRTTVADITKDIKTDEDKVKAIYKWVQANIKYVANEYGLGGFVPRAPKLIFEKRYGDCKDMASIIVGLLKMVNIKAYYTWVGTNELPYTYEELPSSIVDNHMIATWVHNGKNYFLDATNHGLPITMPSMFIQGKEALIMKDDSAYEIVKVPVLPAEKNVVTDSVSFTTTDDKVEGTGILNLTGYYFTSTMSILDRIKDNTDKDKYMLKYLEKGNNKFNLAKYVIASSDTNMSINYSFDVANYVNKSGDEIYVNLNFQQLYKDEDLLKDERTLDYEMSFWGTYKMNVLFTIPQGYEVTYVPKDNTFFNDKFNYSIKYKNLGDKIDYTIEFTTKVLLMKKESFAAWNQMLKQIRGDFKETLVLKKK